MEILLGIAGLVIAVLLYLLNKKDDNQRHREALAADNARHLEEIKRQDEIRKTDAEQERLQWEANHAKQKELSENEQKFHLTQEREKKNSLILNILAEIHTIQDFLIVTPQLYGGGSYSLSVHALVGTVPQQVNSFSNQILISKLNEYRTYLQKLIETFNKVNNYDVRNATSAQSLSNVIPHTNWNSMNYEGRRIHAALLEMLIAEFDGEVPNELRRLRTG